MVTRLAGTMRFENDGQRQLCEKLPNHGDAVRLARKLKKAPSLVSRWKSGKQKPDTTSRIQIFKDLKIRIEAWDREPKESRGQRAEPGAAQ